VNLIVLEVLMQPGKYQKWGQGNYCSIHI